MIIFFAGYLTDHKKDLGKFGKGFFLPIMLIGAPIFILYFVQNHLSVSLVVAIVTFVMMLMAGVRMLYFMCAGAVGAGGIRNPYCKKFSGKRRQCKWRFRKL